MKPARVPRALGKMFRIEMIGTLVSVVCISISSGYSATSQSSRHLLGPMKKSLKKAKPKAPRELLGESTIAAETRERQGKHTHSMVPSSCLQRILLEPAVAGPLYPAEGDQRHHSSV